MRLSIGAVNDPSYHLMSYSSETVDIAGATARYSCLRIAFVFAKK